MSLTPPVPSLEFAFEVTADSVPWKITAGRVSVIVGSSR